MIENALTPQDIDTKKADPLNVAHPSLPKLEIVWTIDPLWINLIVVTWPSSKTSRVERPTKKWSEIGLGNDSWVRFIHDALLHRHRMRHVNQSSFVNTTLAALVDQGCMGKLDGTMLNLVVLISQRDWQWAANGDKGIVA